MLKRAFHPFSQNNFRWVLTILGTLAWSWTMVKSGWIYSFGMGFWGANGHDGVWHIALIESLGRGSFQMPVFAGRILQNYHIGFDFIVALLHKITFIPVATLYFQIIPPLLALFTGVLTYKFVIAWTKSEKAAFWSVFFTYFGGSFGWVLGKGESAFWSQQAISSLINPPFAFSLIILLSGLIYLLKYQEKPSFKHIIISSLLFGILIEIKAYAGILVLGGLFVAGLYTLVIQKRSQIIKVFILSSAISLLIFLPLNRNSASLLTFTPFWFLETMMSYSDRLGWEKFYSAMTSYKSGHVWIKEIPAYLIALTIFYVGNLGTRIIKEILIWKWLKNLKQIHWIEIMLTSIIVAGVLIPMFFLQKGTPWNTIQFFYYSLFFSGILAGIALSNIKSRLVVWGIVLLTIPTTVLTLKDVYIPSRPPAMLPTDEISALNFLSKQPEGTVLTYPFDAIASANAVNNPPRPLYLYVSTAYVSAFGGHPTFLEDEVNLDITGYDWRSRRGEIENWYKEANQEKAREFLKTSGIKYIYWVKPQRALLGDKQLGLKNIFENKSVIIYQVATQSDK